MIRTLKCEELSPCIKLPTSGRCTSPNMLTGGGGGELSVLIGYEDTGDSIREGGMYSTLSAWGQEVGKEAAHHQAPCSLRTDLCCYWAKHAGDILMPYQNINKRPAERSINNRYIIAFAESWKTKSLLLNPTLQELFTQYNFEWRCLF